MNIMDIFEALSESDLLTLAFGIGAFAVLIAILGRVPVIGSDPLSGRRALVLTFFGLMLMGSSATVFVLGTSNTDDTSDLTSSGSSYSTPPLPLIDATATVTHTRAESTVDLEDTDIIDSPTASPASADQGSPSVNCVATMQGPLAQTDHSFSGPVHVVELWRQNGDSPWGSSGVTAVVVGDLTIKETGGNAWTYPSAECEAVAHIHMTDGAKATNSIIVTEEDLRAAGLIE